MRSGRGRGEMENKGKKRDKICVCVCVCVCMCVCKKQWNGERLWVDVENAIFNGRGSGIDQSDCVL